MHELPRRNLVQAAFAVLAFACALPAAAEDGGVVVMTDRAKVFRIDKPADTVIVGNPAIADVTMHDRNTVVVTGKVFGTTNLVILDRNAEPIIDEVIIVRPSDTGLVTVQRNVARFSYSCSPVCEPTLRVGDQKDTFELTTQQVESRNKMAEAQAGVAN
ncbi:pilus assembly protein N-terminal domain-containing protein [Stappia sp. F7233]|uniref:Pilus assembly protein N-terminal domain-containing protein n=1 Tax=Stappia albiluteola TaxID=2758565 RepID=A0A839AAM1_9HYPH|nr:pilus assembly protein N-terminal domain-containing protein [Stappia albiluteola]MBA5776236.1 pilus assembly protein N-terminal domain-containing protein [Stappia albiluteola]